MDTEEKKNDFYNTNDRILLFGPLWLDREKRKVMTVFYSEVFLSEDEFKTLFLLANNEGKSLTFDDLYISVWEKGDGTDRRGEALDGINKIVQQINSVEPGMLWIEYRREFGYVFRLHEIYHHDVCLMRA